MRCYCGFGYVVFRVEVGGSGRFGFGVPLAHVSPPPRLLIFGGGRAPGSAVGGLGVWVSVCLAAASLVLAGSPAAGAAPDTPAEPPPSQEGFRLADVAPADPQTGQGPLESQGEDGGGPLEGGDGGGGGPELDGDGGGLSGGLGPAADDAVGVADVLGDDGVYRWADGDRVVAVRPLEGVPGFAAGGASGLAGQSGGSGNSTLGEWWVTDTGQELRLLGGVSVIFRADVSRAEVGEVLGRHGASLGDAEPIDGLADGFVVEASPAESLRLAAGLAGEALVVAASPNWYSPESFDWSGADSPSEDMGSLSGAGGGVVVANGLGVGAERRRYCSDLAPRETWRWEDELHLCAWHLDADTAFRGTWGFGVDPSVDINIGDVWDITKGQGVMVAIADTRWNGHHEDLRDNIDAAHNSQWGGASGAHGTMVAGLVGARDNGVGSRGVAPRATLVNFVIYLNGFWGLGVKPWTLHSDVVGVANHSSGKVALGLARAPSTWWAAVDAVLASGLGGLGTAFTKAAGNDGDRISNRILSTFRERANHRGLMVVCAVGHDGTHTYASYSTKGANLWLCAPSLSNFHLVGLVTTFGQDQYTTQFGGTSGATPQVAGVAALVRSVNPYLTWRDVKLLLADTAQRNDPGDSSWAAGAARYSDAQSTYSYSHKYGFGVVDAEAAVEKAFSWPLLPAEKTSETASSGPDVVLENGVRTTELSLSVTTGIDFVEHVNVDLNMVSDKFRDFDVTLVSPAGRESTLAAYEPVCGNNCGINGMFRFGATRHLGEDPNGAWKLRFHYRGELEDTPADVSPVATVRSWTVKIYGHTGPAPAPVPGVSLTIGTDELIEATAAEGDDLIVTAHLHNGPLTANLVVPVEIAKQSAANPSDTAADFSAPASVTIPAGSTTATATITVIDDGTDEGAEEFAVELGTMPSGYHALGVAPTITVMEDSREVAITAGTGVYEGGDAVFTLAASLAPLVPLPVSVSITQDGDFGVSTGTRTVMMPTTGSVSFSVGTVDDDVFELDGSVTATVVPETHYAVGSASSVSVTVADNEMVVSLSSSVSAVAEASGEAVVTVSLSRRLVSNDQVAEWVRVPLSVSGGTEGVHWKLGLRRGNTVGGVVLQRDSVGPSVLLYNRGQAAELVLTALPNTDAVERTITMAVGTGPRAPAGGGIDEVFVRAGSVSVDIVNDDTGLPLVSVSAGGDVTEGGDAQFTVTAVPAPSADLDVDVTVAATGDFGAATGKRTVTVPPSGSATFSVGTADDGDDEPDGSITATVEPGSGYTRGSPFSASVAIADDDHAPKTLPTLSISGGAAITEGGTAVFTVTAVPPPSKPMQVNLLLGGHGNFRAVQKASTVVTMPIGGSLSYSVLTADDGVDEPDGSVTVEVRPSRGFALGSPTAASVAVADNDPTPGADPVVSITAIGDVTEGSAAQFTVTAVPAPTADLDVSVTVAQSGDYGVAGGTRTVTVPTSGSTTLSVSTAGDDIDEPDGSVTATVNSGSGYTVSATAAAATAAIADDDDPPPPVVSISSVGDVTEGSAAQFTVTASPAPAANLAVSVTVTASGDYGAATGTRTVTVPASGSATLSVSTTGDQTDEPDGSVTATVNTSAAYTVSATAGAATVSVADDDDPPPVVPEVSIAAVGDVTEGSAAQFTVTASPAPAADLAVSVTVTAAGDFGAATGARTVTVPASGSATLSVSTTGDQTDEPDGSVTATVNTSADYTVSATAGAATVSVADDDDPPPVVVPVVSISSVGDVTEGSAAQFTVTASPAPAADLAVSVTVAATGEFGAPVGARTVTIASGANSATFTVATTGDDADEPDGSVTATVNTSADYTVSATAGVATAAVADDDDPPGPDVPGITVEEASATEGGLLEFRILLSRASTQKITINWYATTAWHLIDNRAHRSDYQPTGGTMEFEPGTTALTATVWLEHDSQDEPDEHFAVEAFLPGKWFTPADVGTMTIIDDD